jgi:hypothetical protein
MGNAGQTRELPRGVTFEAVWAMFQETDRKLEETARIVKETTQQMKETDRKMAETDREIKETSRLVGKITNRFGDIVEHMVLPNLVSKFQDLSFTFTQASKVKITDKQHRIFMEIDAFLENGEKAMVVEIKTKPSIEDINEHIERMEKRRVYADLHDDKRIYLGAVAGVVFGDSEKNYALKNGFYVLEPSGETFTITEPKAGGYSPREW